MPYKRSLEERLFARREIDPARGCWLWTGKCYTNGYGTIKLGGRAGKFRKVHRVAASLWLNIDLDSPMHVLHHCDVRRCFNPEHLYGGTNADNVHDRATRKRGREHRQRGAAHHMAKLTDDDVREIRRLVARGHRQREIADTYGVKVQQISRIICRTMWTHVV